MTTIHRRPSLTPEQRLGTFGRRAQELTRVTEYLIQIDAELADGMLPPWL